MLGYRVHIRYKQPHAENRMATSKISTPINNVLSRSSTSVLTFAKNQPKGGVCFYATVGSAPDNPDEKSYFFIIYSNEDTAICILAIGNGSREMYLNTSTNSGTTWGGWKAVTMSA